MIEIYKNVFIGNEQDYYSIQHEPNWAALHCCKNPFHCDFVGYKGSLTPDHPDYALKRRDNEMALNIVDMNQFNEKYLDLNRNMYKTAFAFLDEYKDKGYQLLIHCNQGESRAPTLGMLYAARLGAFDYVDFESSVEKLRLLCPGYNPKQNIYLTVQSLWDDFVKNP